MGNKAQRKFLAHYINVSFGAEKDEYIRLGEDLEEFAEELNPEVETKKNIIGENRVDHSGYDPSAESDPFYYRYDDKLSEKVFDIAMNRKKGDDCKTTKVDVLLAEDGTVIKAWKEDVYVIPNSVGGDATGVQVPFTLYNAGNREEGTWDMTTKTFTKATPAVN